MDQRRPATILGEQVASKDADPWLDLVHTDMEALGYAFGAVAFPSAGVGAPHIRDRTYWLAYSSGERRNGRQDSPRPRGWLSFEASRAVGGLAYASGARPQRRQFAGQRSGAQLQTPERGGAACGLANTADQRQHGRRPSQASDGGNAARLQPQRLRNAGGMDNAERLGLDQIGDGDNGGNVGQLPGPTVQGSPGPGPVNGLWRAADWLLCRDGKWRPVEPGTFPLAHGATARVGRLRAYGNAINAQAAQTFIEAAMSSIDEIA
ncbi:DNA cytosine methyltransferase [Comamonas sp.]|uniref:DNA cytosine methyltransferase n=1 Tax=Comamonas sp. TaxID=34028 RepID=UPI0028AFBCA1|nr:DNA cytosine methyltransferase [Comamonas sp.]